MVAEADEGDTDHVAIAYTLKNWLELRQRVHPQLTYGDVIRGVCAVHSTSTPSKRQLWIRQLDFPRPGDDGNPIFTKPVDFPKKASWERKQKKWFQILQRAWRWSRGEYRDPCQGKSVVWGAPQDPNNMWYLASDVPSERVTRVQCRKLLKEDLENWYYRLKTRQELIADGVE